MKLTKKKKKKKKKEKEKKKKKKKITENAEFEPLTPDVQFLIQ